MPAEAERPYRVSDVDRDGAEVARLAAQVDLIAGPELAALDAVGLPPHGRGVEIGCGPGFFAAGLVRPGRVLFGLDIDAYALRVARVPVARGDAQALPFQQESADFLCARLFLRHVTDPAAVLAQMIPVVKRGGRVIVVDGCDASLVVDPLPADFPFVVAGRRAWFARRRCHPDIGAQLGRLLAEVGLTDIRERSLAMDTAAMGAAAFSRAVLSTFLQAARSAGGDVARLAAAGAAIEEWAHRPGASGSISVTVASGARG